jgi:hypothetical protein
MERTIRILALMLAVAAGLGCKDSNQNYIVFDAQVTDTKSDTPASDAARDTSTGSPADASLGEAGHDAALDLAAGDSAATDADSGDANPSDSSTTDTEPGQ